MSTRFFFSSKMCVQVDQQLILPAPFIPEPEPKPAPYPKPLPPPYGPYPLPPPAP